MSASLLRRGLELLEPPGEPAGPGCAGGQSGAPRYGCSDSVPLPVAGRAKVPPGLQRGWAGPRAAGAARRRKMAPEPGRNKATVKGRVVKSATEEYRKKKPVNHLRENLQYMLKGRLVADKAVTEQVLAQNRGRKSKDQPPEKTEKKKPKGTVFTEEDFRKFEREYFGVP
ncbi:AROS regulator, partial [Horornis vulcanius]|nr:AROS regulator [Horornis vulcanius]